MPCSSSVAASFNVATYSLNFSSSNKPTSFLDCGLFCTNDCLSISSQTSFSPTIIPDFSSWVLYTFSRIKLSHAELTLCKWEPLLFVLALCCSTNAANSSRETLSPLISPIELVFLLNSGLLESNKPDRTNENSANPITMIKKNERSLILPKIAIFYFFYIINFLLLYIFRLDL